MYISLRESNKNGFKRWSDSRQPANGHGSDTKEGCAIAVPGSALTSPPVCVAAHPLLLTAEKSL